MRFLFRCIVGTLGLVLIGIAAVLALHRTPGMTWIAFAAQDGAEWVVFRSDAGNEPVAVARIPHHASGEQNAQEVAWSPDGNWLAFAHDGKIYRVRIDGSGLEQLTEKAHNASKPVWLAGGEYIQFVTGSGAIGRVFQMRADGSELHLTADRTYLDSEPSRAVSPDGRLVAWTYNRGVFRAQTSGDQYRPVVQPRRITDPDLITQSPVWSPLQPAPVVGWPLTEVGLLLLAVAAVPSEWWRRIWCI